MNPKLISTNMVFLEKLADLFNDNLNLFFGIRTDKDSFLSKVI